MRGANCITSNERTNAISALARPHRSQLRRIIFPRDTYFRNVSCHVRDCQVSADAANN